MFHEQRDLLIYIEIYLSARSVSCPCCSQASTTAVLYMRSWMPRRLSFAKMLKTAMSHSTHAATHVTVSRESACGFSRTSKA